MHDPGFFVRCNIFCVPSLFVLLSFSRSCSLNCAFVRRLRVPRTSWVFSTIFFFLLFQYCLFTSNTIFFFSKFRKYPRRPVRDSWRLISNAKKKKIDFHVYVSQSRSTINMLTRLTMRRLVRVRQTGSLTFPYFKLQPATDVTHTLYHNPISIDSISETSKKIGPSVEIQLEWLDN